MLNIRHWHRRILNTKSTRHSDKISLKANWTLTLIGVGTYPPTVIQRDSKPTNTKQKKTHIRLWNQQYSPRTWKGWKIILTFLRLQVFDSPRILPWPIPVGGCQQNRPLPRKQEMASISLLFCGVCRPLSGLSSVWCTSVCTALVGLFPRFGCAGANRSIAEQIQHAASEVNQHKKLNTQYEQYLYITMLEQIEWYTFSFEIQVPFGLPHDMSIQFSIHQPGWLYPHNFELWRKILWKQGFHVESRGWSGAVYIYI